ncbi:hypothetical protein TIFTF001_024809 [Ficus carica]|uniref:Uncharacterized protein n=1 Tax=Ficus carica TaxID=3494 RepID=A0AA88AYA8_FICCA|nr:hypothetical protein TIFTF001_024809 [Ficus carica]
MKTKRHWREITINCPSKFTLFFPRKDLSLSRREIAPKKDCALGSTSSSVERDRDFEGEE